MFLRVSHLDRQLVIRSDDLLFGDDFGEPCVKSQRQTVIELLPLSVFCDITL